ncbi:MAG: leucine-rich repeat protein [Muribaculaceae bacterium]|nr:leucine-rich repeat protein [Muribaculaceae bacterium]
MRRLTFTLLLVMVALVSRAVTVHCEPGKLGLLLTSNNVTELTITGKMDARDFRTLADRLRGLSVLNLHGVEVLAYDSDEALFSNVYRFRAHEIPTLSLADMPQLTRLTLPWQVTSLGEGAVAACTSLTEVTLPKNLTYLGKYSFVGCTALKTIALPAMLVEIGEGAFAQCTSLTKVTLQNADITPNGENSSPYQQASCHLTTVGKAAFAGCKKLTSITLGNQLKTIGDAAFAGTKLSNANLSSLTELTQVGDWAYAQTPITTAQLPNQTELGRGAFVLNKSLASINIPFVLDNVPPLLLAGSDKVAEVDLSRIYVDSIGDYAFYNLNQVQQLTIPITTKYVGTRTMAGMTGLQQITTYAQSVPDLGEAVWQGVEQANVVLMTPNNSVDYYNSAEQWREFNVQSNIIPGDVNGDGIVDIADLNAVINYMLGKVIGTFIFEAGDLNHNWVIDIADVNAVINLMLGHSMNAPNFTPDTGDALVIDNFGINTSEHHTIDIRLDDCRDYTAMQCIIHLPDGLKVVEGGILSGLRAPSHSVVSQSDGNEVAIVLYANPNVNLGDNHDDPILQLTVTATDVLPPQATLLADHVTMVTADGDSYHAPATTALVSRTSGVDQVSSSTDRVYGANGSLYIVAQQAGKAQLVALNGMTRTLRVEPGNNAYHNIDPGIYIVRLNSISHKVKL